MEIRSGRKRFVFSKRLALVLLLGGATLFPATSPPRSIDRSDVDPSWNADVDRTAATMGSLAEADAVATDATDAATSSINASDASDEPVATRTDTRGANVPSLARLPTYFVENAGQFDSAACFVASDRRVRTALTRRGLSFAAPEPLADGTAAWRMSAIDFVAADRRIEPRGVSRLPGTHSYFIGNDPSRWAAGVATFSAVQYDAVAPGVDLIVVERDGTLAYDLHVEPGADLASVEFTYQRCGPLSLADDGALVVPTEIGELRQLAPKAWYARPDGTPLPVACSFELRGAGRFGFRVDGGARGDVLIVDPTLQWSTYFGGEMDDFVQAIDVDSGLVTIGGRTTSANSGSDPFPIYPATTPSNVQVVHGGAFDAFIARLDPSQSGAAQLVFSTFLGGPSSGPPPATVTNGFDEITDLEIDASGGVAFVGNTDTLSFPVSTNALLPSIPSPGSLSGFVGHLTIVTTPSFQVVLDYSTHFGGTGGPAYIRGLDLNAGTIVTFGGAAWDGLPLTGNADDTTWEAASSEDAFCARLDWTKGPSNALVYSSYLSRYVGIYGKGGKDYVTAVAWSGNRIWAGGTSSNVGFQVGTPSGAPVFDTVNNGGGVPYDGFILRLDPTLASGQQIEYSTFIGGSGAEELLDIDVANGAVYACGHTASSDFPVTPALNSLYEAPGHKRDLSGTVDAWVVKLKPQHNPASSAYDLRYGTYLGGTEGEFARSIRRLASKAVVVVGETGSSGSTGTPFPTGSIDLGATFDSTMAGQKDAFVTHLSWAGLVPSPGNQNPIPQQIKYSTFHGCDADDYGLAVAIDGYDVYAAGYSFDVGLPLVGNVFDSTQSSLEGWVARWSLPTSSQ